MNSRRTFLAGSAAGFFGAAMVSRVGAASLPEAPIRETAEGAPPLVPSTGRPYNPVVTLNGWSLPWRMDNGWKEFHLVAEPVRRQLAPGMTANLWGYNGQSPGPTIECVEGDKVRIFVTNKLPEHTTIHWHGVLLPNGMDGVGGLTQPHIPVGKTFVYEFEMKHSGTFMYHPHADEMVQMAMGLMGSIVVHPRDPNFMPVDRDFAFLTASYDIEPGAYTPKVAEMTDFNLWTFNSRVFPGIDHLAVRRGDRVRVRIGNLTMTNHPIHIHGHNFTVACTDGGWVPKTARWPETSVDMPVGALRAIEFIADNPGDWAFHCHKSHHVMNAMGHDVPTMIGVDHRGVAERINKLIPDYMLMGERGMADMGEMQMPLPDNTLPMMSGSGPFGAMEMGGMFTVVKVRDGLARNDYKDPGWYKHPAGTVAYEWEGEVPRAERKPAAPAGDVELKARKPSGHAGHQGDVMKALLFVIAMAAAPLALAHGEKSHNAKGIDYSKAEEHAFGRAADPKKAKRTVRVDMTDQMRFHPAEITVKRGEIVRFVPVNKGQVLHEMVLGTMDDLKKHAELMRKHPGMEHDEPHMAHVAPGKSGEMGWQFRKTGEFYYGCLIPGHFEAGMIGKVKVTP